MLNSAIDLLKELGAWNAILAVIAIAVAKVLWDTFVKRS